MKGRISVAETRPIRYCGDAWDRELITPVWTNTFPRDEVTGELRPDLQLFKWPDGTERVVHLYAVAFDSQQVRDYLGITQPSRRSK